MCAQPIAAPISAVAVGSNSNGRYSVAGDVLGRPSYWFTPTTGSTAFVSTVTLVGATCYGLACGAAVRFSNIDCIDRLDRQHRTVVQLQVAIGQSKATGQSI